MKTTNPPALRRFLRRIRSWLPCPGSMKRMILSDIRDNALDFLQEHPEADYASLEAHFGAPGRIAASYIQDLDSHKLLQELRLKRRITTAVISVLVAALLVWVGAAIVSISDFKSHNKGHWVVDEIVEHQEIID